MRNVFDQYTQTENYVTHAVITALVEDELLRAEFLREIAKINPPINSSLTIAEQSLPGRSAPPKEEAEKRGVPNAWFTTDENWCLLMESKVLSDPAMAQLASHVTTVNSLGFSDPYILLTTIMLPEATLPHRAKVVEWKQVDPWLKRRASQQF